MVAHHPDGVSLNHMRLCVFLHWYSVWHRYFVFGIMHKDALACVYMFVLTYLHVYVHM